MTVTTLRPRAAGSNSALNIFGIKPTAWQALSDQDNTTGVQTNNPSPTTGSDTCPCTTFSLPPGDTQIDKIRLHIIHYEDVGGIYHGTSKTFLYIDGAHTYLGPALYNASWTDSYTEYTQNPKTSAAWTVTDINAAEFGANGSEGSHLGVYYDTYISEVYVEVFSSSPVQQQIITLDGITLTITKHDERLEDVCSEWDAWSSGAAKRKIKIYNTIKTYLLDCVEHNIVWANSVANHFEATALSGATVVFYSNATLRPVNNVNVYVTKVTYTLENIGTQNIRKVTLTLQEAQ